MFLYRRSALATHKLAERAVEEAIPPQNIICRVPVFITAAVIAKHTNAIATLPMSIVTVLAQDLNLEIVKPPIKLPKIEIHQYWHNRFHREPGNKWIRSVFLVCFTCQEHEHVTEATTLAVMYTSR
jgi:hypothetical protein